MTSTFATDPSADIIGIDAGAVNRWFKTLGVGFAGPLTFDRMRLGQSNLAYVVRDRGRGLTVPVSEVHGKTLAVLAARALDTAKGAAETTPPASSPSPWQRSGTCWTLSCPTPDPTRTADSRH